jgi:hypothetical protein
MNSLKTCFHCNTEEESNEHLWKCPQPLNLLRPIFNKHELILNNLLKTHADTLEILIDNTIRRTLTFAWTRIINFTLQPSHPLYLFLHGFIPNDLIHTFTAHIKGYKKIKSLFLSFIHNLTFEIRSKVWKHRNILFKEWKKNNNITKKSFKNYKNTNNRNRRNIQNNPHYHRNPSPTTFFTLDDARRQISTHVAYIYATSSNFLHNGPWYNHICTNELSIPFYQLNFSCKFYYSLSG